MDLTYAQYQGIPTLDPVNNETITRFLGIRYAAAPTGKGSVAFIQAVYQFRVITLKTGSRRFREPQLPSYTPGVQLANKGPPMCWQAGMATAPKTPFRNTIVSSNTKRLETRDEPDSSEDCLFLK